MCFNAVEMNAVTVPTKHHVPECMNVVDELWDANFMSLIDLKGAFHNHPIDQESLKYMGFITQDGMFRWLRMPFGCTNAPGKLQSSLDLCIHEKGRLRTEVYYDDITPHGHTLEDTWETTLATLERLVSNGYMINLNKCVFLTQQAKLLGFEIRDGRYQLG